MKKIGLIIAFFISVSVMAQESSWGVKGGLNFNLSEMGIANAYNSVGDIVSGQEAENGWHIGLLSRNYLTDIFFVQFEGLYSKTSTAISGTNYSGSAPVNFSNNFVNEVGQFNILGGLEFFDFLRTHGGLIGKLSFNEEYASTFGTFRVGYNLGAGINLGRFNFDISYNSSFSDHQGEWNSIPLSYSDSELLFSVAFLLKKKR